MGRTVKGALGLLGVAVGLLVAACASSPSATDSRAVGQGDMPPAYSSTAGVLGAQATARAGGAVATASPAMIQATLTNLDQFRDQLNQLAGGSPTTTDLIAMAQKASALMNDIRSEIAQMTPEQKDAALARMSEISLQMSRVVQARERVQAASGTVTARRTMTPDPMMTPGAMMGGRGGTPGAMMSGTPGAMMSGQMLIAAVDELRNRMMSLASNQPSNQDIEGVIDHLQYLLVTARQQWNSLSPSEQEQFVDDLTRAFNDLLPVIQARIQVETGSVPTVTIEPTMTSTAAPTSTTGPTSVATVTPIGSATATSAAVATSTPIPTVTWTPVPTATPIATSTPMPTPTP